MINSVCTIKSGHELTRQHQLLLLTFELSDVVALCSRDSRSVSWTPVDISSSISADLAAAFWNESEIVVGWMPTNRHQHHSIDMTHCIDIRHCIGTSQTRGLPVDFHSQKRPQRTDRTSMSWTISWTSTNTLKPHTATQFIVIICCNSGYSLFTTEQKRLSV